jgi:hypothetical protein
VAFLDTQFNGIRPSFTLRQVQTPGGQEWYVLRKILIQNFRIVDSMGVSCLEQETVQEDCILSLYERWIGPGLRLATVFNTNICFLRPQSSSLIDVSVLIHILILVLSHFLLSLNCLNWRENWSTVLGIPFRQEIMLSFPSSFPLDVRVGICIFWFQ